MSGVKRNAVASGVREEWIDRVVDACEAICAHAVPHRIRSTRSLFEDFEKEIVDARSATEDAVLRAMLVDVSLRWGHADHWAYHTEFPDAECAEDPAARALTVWHQSPAHAKSAFRRWSRAYLDTMERVHPRYRAMELRRDLDSGFAHPVSVAELARRRGVTARCLQRDFLELTGRTIRDYVTERRLDTAVRLLKGTPDKVEWIANVVGWSSRKNLNRALALRRGVKPEEIRSSR